MNTTLIRTLFSKNCKNQIYHPLRKMCDSQAIKVKEVKIPVPWGHIAGKFCTSFKLSQSFDT